MWRNADGVAQVELNWDDPWVVFSPGLQLRMRDSPQEYLEQVEDALWATLPDVILNIAKVLPIWDPAVEAEYVGRELERKPWLKEGNGDLDSLLLSQISEIDSRWRLDVLQTALQALSR